MLLWKIKASPNGDSNFMGQTNSLQEQKLSTFARYIKEAFSETDKN